jgi:hypothetical protein
MHLEYWKEYLNLNGQLSKKLKNKKITIYYSKKNPGRSNYLMNPKANVGPLPLIC